MNSLLKSKDRIAIVDLVRTASILMVICAHLRYSGAFQADGLLSLLWKGVTRNGAYGVTLFFVVSGFLITRMTAMREPDLFRPSLRGFYSRRLARIIPLFAAIVALGAAVMVLVPQQSPQLAFCFKQPDAVFDWSFWLSLMTFSFNWLRVFRETQFGLHWDVCWSLAIEEQFYIFYPLLLTAIGNEKKMIRFLLGIVLLGPIARAAAFLWRPFSFLSAFTNSFGAFDLIALGCLLFFARRHWKDKLSLRQCSVLCASGAIIGTVIYLSSSVLKSGIDRIYGPSVLGLALFLFLLGGLSLTQFDKLPRWLLMPGELSYGCYLLHATVLFCLWPLLSKLNVLLALPLFVLSTTLIATASFHFLEKPANRRIRQAFQPAGPPAAEVDTIQSPTEPPHFFSRFDKPEYFFRPSTIARRISRGAVPEQAEQLVALNWGVDLSVNTHEVIGSTIWRSGIHDLVVSEAVWRLLKPGDAAIDAGAHVGYMSSLMVAKCGHAGRVIAFEPHPQLFEMLSQNAARWRSGGATIEARNSALSDSSGATTLISGDYFLTNQGTSFVAQAERTADETEIQNQVVSETLDGVIKNGEQICLLKVDVEGHELNLFHGAGTLLSSGSITHIVFEDWGAYPTPAMKLLQQNNYTLFGLGRTFWGPVLSSPDKQPGMRTYDSPAYLATRDPSRAMDMIRPRGWQVLGTNISS